MRRRRGEFCLLWNPIVSRSSIVRTTRVHDELIVLVVARGKEEEDPKGDLPLFLRHVACGPQTTPTMSAAPPSDAHPPFRKILYAAQPYPDNYVDATFLSTLQRNRSSLLLPTSYSL